MHGEKTVIHIIEAIIHITNRKIYNEKIGKEIINLIIKIGGIPR